MAEVKPKRAYRSGRRAENAAATRAAIRDAARRLFSERGYSGATIEAIAEAAGVAAITVYATFGSKKALLKDLVDVSVGGDERPVALLEREGPQAVRGETDQRRQIRMFASGIAEIMERVSPVFEVMRCAATSDEDVETMLESLLQQRMHGMRFFVDALAANGALRDGLSRRSAAESVWALSSPDLHRLVTQRLGWTRARYASWLRDALTALLLG